MVTVYGKVPLTEGDPAIVNTFAAHVPVTPAGNPVADAPVAPKVE
jgi:hypothetical protein